MKFNELNNSDEHLDNLFKTAQNQAPKYAFTEASSVFSSALALGVTTAAHAKLITSSIFKSKIFIMSISTITAITSAVLIYSSAASNGTPKINSTAAEKGHTTEKVMTYATQPEGALFATDDTLKRENTSKDSLKMTKLEIQENILKAQIILRDAQVKTLELDLNTLEELDINIDNLTDQIDFSIDDIEDLTMSLNDLEIDLEELSLLSNIEVGDLEDFLEKEVEVIYNNRSYEGDDDLETVSYFITQATTMEELDEMKKAATKAGINFTYNAKVKKNIIKKLNLQMTLLDPNGRTKRECMTMSVSGGEMFSHTLQWKVDEKGKAVSFGRAECRTASRGGTTSTTTSTKKIVIEK